MNTTDWIDFEDSIPFNDTCETYLVADVNCDVYLALWDSDKKVWLNKNVFWNRPLEEKILKDIIFWAKIADFPQEPKNASR